MGRQLFLHHYLPAHLASALVTGALLEFVVTMDPAGLEELSQGTIPDGKGGKKKGVTVVGRRTLSAKERMGSNMLWLWVAAGVVMVPVLWGWYFFLPLTYGKPGLDVAGVVARKWLGYDLHFAK
jgi:dolichyl-phosphate-mannose-protein mannosyltransferase